MGSVGAKQDILTTEYKERITSGIVNHTKAENDVAESSYKRSIAKEKETVDGYADAIKKGLWNESDPRTEYHRNAYKTLQAQYEFFRKERKRLGR